MADREDVLNVVRAQESATARSDAEAVLAAMDRDVVVFDLPPPLEARGVSAPYAEGLKAWFTTWEHGVRVELTEPTVWIEGDLAVVFGLSRMRGTKKDQGAVDNWSRRTVVLRRRDGAWQITHDHKSYPLRMDGSNEAATDLQPEKR